MSTGAVFLDRDGTLVREVNYLSRIEDLEVLDGVAGALRALSAAGYKLIVITNQAGIARGYFDRETVDTLNRELERRLGAEGVRIEAFYVCPHHPEHPRDGHPGPCDCRKPQPGMLLAAAAEHDIDLASSWMVGDKEADVLAGANAGCKSCLVMTGYGEKHLDILDAAGVKPDIVASDVADFAKKLLEYS